MCRTSRFKSLLLCLLSVASLFACATPEPPGPKPGIRESHLVLEDGFLLDYQIETRMSKIDGRSCYVFVSGTLTNPTPRKLLRHSRLDFRVYKGGTLLFRDVSHPRLDVGPGSRVQFELIESPVFSKHCPSVDRVEASLLRLY